MKQNYLLTDIKSNELIATGLPSIQNLKDDEVNIEIEEENEKDDISQIFNNAIKRQKNMTNEERIE